MSTLLATGYWFKCNLPNVFTRKEQTCINLYINIDLHDTYNFFISFCDLCVGQEEFRTRYAGECLIDNACPSGCSCDGTIVDCSGRGLKEVPRDVPLYTTEL